MTRYYLPDWAHLCFTSDAAVFLDIKHDRYHGLSETETKILRDMVKSEGRCTGEPNPIISELTAHGLMTSAAEPHCRPLAPTSVDRPDSLLLAADDIDETPPVTLLHVTRFLSACLSTTIALRFGSLERAIRRLQRHKARMPASAIPDLQSAKELTRAFVYMRTFVYTAKEHCLYDSLVLVDFLRRFGIPSNCVFAVRTLPFAAHCWVQIGRSLATESSVEGTAVFHPILCV